MNRVGILGTAVAGPLCAADHESAHALQASQRFRYFG
jgi:hypothetical protein